MATLRGLNPALRPWAEWLYKLGKYYDSRLVVTSGFRSSRKQGQLYQRYLSGKSPIPAAPPGQSLHERGLAFDLARSGVDPFQDELLHWLSHVWKQIGGGVGGERDPVHFSVKLR